MPDSSQASASASANPRVTGNSRRRAGTGASATAASNAQPAAVKRYHSAAVPHPLRISDQQLVKNAQLAARSIDWDTLRSASTSWDTKKTTTSGGTSGGFSIMARQEGDMHQIMARGSIACSVAEMQHALWATSDERYLAAMRELHGASFLSGVVLHRLDSSAVTADANAAAPVTALPPSASSGYDLLVKTATFAKAHVFARDEHWCFLDYLQPQCDRSGFTITMHSLRAEDVLPATCTSSSNNSGAALDTQSKNQLQEMTAGYSVTADPRGRLVSLAFYARFLDASSSSGASNSALRASKSTTKARLLKIASATCSLPAVVQRRRLGAQVFVDPAVFAALPNNTHCKCCTVALTLFVAKKRCHLCGYRVCAKCSSRHEIERARSSRRSSSSGSTSLEIVHVCTKCMHRVNAANYDDLPSGLASPPSIKPDHNKDVSKLLVEYLRRSFENATNAPRKRALVQVVRSLLEDAESSVTSSASARSRSDTASSRACSVNGDGSKPSGDIDDDGHACIASLEDSLHVREIALEDCVVAHADSRSYPIDYRERDESGDGSSSNDDVDDDAVTHYPVPASEQSRIDFVAKQQLTDMTDVPELEIICAIASQEMGCPAGLVTIIADDKIHIIASNDSGYQNLVVPRAESICSHLVMSDKPLLLPHLAADIRFSKMPPVRHAGLRFYCGFPLVSPDNAVYGSVCCVDSKSHDVTQSQYTVMTKLAATAARIMELRAPKA